MEGSGRAAVMVLATLCCFFSGARCTGKPRESGSSDTVSDCCKGTVSLNVETRPTSPFKAA